MIRTAATLCLLAGCATAQDDFVVTEGRLSDEDFYRLVACEAPPGGPCAYDLVRWARTAATPVTVSLQAPAPGYPAALAGRVSDGLDSAIAEINAAGADIAFARMPDGKAADITIHPANIGDGGTISGIGRPEVDGLTIGAAYFHVWWNGRNEITDGLIVLAADIPQAEVQPILLEELTQSLGLLTDIRNPYYETRSVFSQDSNSVAILGKQDRIALRIHYPPQ